jgi:integrase
LFAPLIVLAWKMSTPSRFIWLRRISWPALNQIVCALRFFYGVTLGQDTLPERIAYARQPSKLPVVLSADEVIRFLEAIPSLKSRTALTTVYAAGLRVSEVVLLKVADIDSQRMVIRVEQGKGGKDRYVMLSPQLLRFCAHIGGSLGRSDGCFLAATRSVRSSPRVTAGAVGFFTSTQFALRPER